MGHTCPYPASFGNSNGVSLVYKDTSKGLCCFRNAKVGSGCRLSITAVFASVSKGRVSINTCSSPAATSVSGSNISRVVANSRGKDVRYFGESSNVILSSRNVVLRAKLASTVPSVNSLGNSNILSVTINSQGNRVEVCCNSVNRCDILFGTCRAISANRD